jgi:hypothetical protein
MIEVMKLGVLVALIEIAERHPVALIRGRTGDAR